jgi:hypothetical protein
VNTAGSDDGAVGRLREALTVCAAGESGALRVTGDPGGVIRLTDGRVTAIETPGAPSPEVLLLRSHRVTESGWDEAFAAAAISGGQMGSELIKRTLVGAGELEGLLRTTLADAMFVMAKGTVGEYRAEPGAADFMLPLEPGAEPDTLLAEAVRRIRVLAALPGIGKVVAAPGAAWPGIRLGGGQDEILALADGRRTARDLAFALGRGVYATMLQLARMQQAGLLAMVSSGASGPDTQLPGGPAAEGDLRPASGLPRRSTSPSQRGGSSAAGRPQLRYGQAATTGQVQ